MTVAEIVDPHHHLWHDRGGGAYLLDDLHADTATTPEVVETVFVECHAEYRTDGPEHLRPVGETEFVAAVADESAQSDGCLLYTSPSPRDRTRSRMPSSA